MQISWFGRLGADRVVCGGRLVRNGHWDDSRYVRQWGRFGVSSLACSVIHGHAMMISDNFAFTSLPCLEALRKSRGAGACCKINM